MHPHEHIEELLGFIPFWVPCKRGTKVPDDKYTRRPYEETLDPAYRALLIDQRGDGGPNLAIYLGANSRGLVALDFDKDEHLTAFLNANDRCHMTLTSKGARGAQLWLRITGDIPESSQCKFYEWRAEKRLSTIHGLHPSGVPYRLLVEAPPLEMAFSDLHWPEDWPVPGSDQRERDFIERHGEPWATDKHGAPVKLNQRHFAGRIAERGQLIFDPDISRFYQYDPHKGVWQYRTEDEVSEAAGRLVSDDISHTVEINPPDMAGPIRKGFLLVNHQFCRGTVGLLRGMTAERGRFRKPRGIIHCANGMLDLNERPFSLKPFDRSYWSRNQVPVNYDPSCGCPRFINELLAPQLSPEDQRLWQLCCGQYLLGRNMFQRFLILTGTAGGGKGTLCKLVTHMIGRNNVHELRTNQLDGRFETSFYHDKTLLYGPDVEPGFLATNGAHFIKSLTGGDYFNGEVKGSPVAHQLEGDYNVLISCNSRLMARLRGDSAAWARRLLIINFEAPPVTAPIPHFDRVLFKEEGSGILNWMLEGAAEIMRCARERLPFPLTPAQQERITSLLAESDSVREFIKRRVRKSNLLADNVTSEDLYKAYLGMCDENGWQPVSQRLFSMKGDEILVTEIRATKDNHCGDERSKRGWRGLVLIDDPDSPESY